ncbi:MAG: hypothetical protein H7A24_07080 [Leptospiraceae bacterium]|nr:hypothetical protein [Leptospiraceae bacterium]MCP5511627.1 hypothetical protein [Leptospiraceae bacterium]
MKKIIRENLKYILTVLIFWAFALPYIYSERDTLFEKYSLFVSPIGYRPKIMKKFMDKADKILANEFLDEKPANEEEWNRNVEPFLNRMQNVCEFYKKSGKRDEILKNPTWYEKNEQWSEDPSRLQPNGHNRSALPHTFDPGEKWKEHEESLLEALDYYKRALNYSGPEFLIAKRIQQVSAAVCRPEEAILAFSTFILNTETYAEKEIYKNKDIKKEMRGKTEKQKFSQVLAHIKSGKAPISTTDYIEGLIKLLKDTGFEKISPKESDLIYEKILFFYTNTTDPRQRFHEKNFRLKRGILLFEMSQREPKYLDRALLEFSAAAASENMSEIQTDKNNFYNALVFEANLYRVRCFLQKGDNKLALTILQKMMNDIRKIDDRAGAPKQAIQDRNLLHDYHLLRRKTLIQLGRKMEADEISYD